jgi:ABC-type uncharacterized transport system involved in gliding motility auxiliary subunit
MLELDDNPKRIVVEPASATRVGTQGGSIRYPFWLSFKESNFNKDLILTNQLSSALFIETGYFNLKSDSENKYVSLVNSSDISGAIDVSKLAMMFSPNDYQNFDKINKPLSVSGMVSGKFKSVFKERPKDSKYTKNHINEADKELSVLVVGDIDFLNNSYSLREVNFFGQTMIQPINQNITFATNALEFVSGSPELISIRSRGSFSRPFDRVERLEQEAQSKWFNVEREINQEIQRLQAKLNSMQSETTKDNQLVLSNEQQKEIQRFKLELLKHKRKRREVRKNLRQDIESLGTTLTVANMTVLPIIILILGLFIYVKRSQGKSIISRRSGNA